MKKEGISELKKLFEQKQKKEKDNSSSKKKKKETKEDKKKQEKLKKEKNKQEDFPQRTFTLAGSELESVRKNLVKNVSQNDKNDKLSNNNGGKETPNELENIKNKLRTSNILANANVKDAKEVINGGVKNNIQIFNKEANGNKDNKKDKKETISSKNVVPNLNKNDNKKEWYDMENEVKDDKNNITNNRKKIYLREYLESVVKSKSFNQFIKDNNKMETKSFNKTDNNIINENEKKVFEKSFDRLVNLQVLLKKESSLKELCKYFYNFNIYSYKNKRRYFSKN
mgnify:CR=1 FL=1